MNFLKIPGIGIALVAFILILVLSYYVDLAVSQVDQARIDKAEDRMEHIIQNPSNQPLFQAGILADAKLKLESAKRLKYIGQLLTWFHVILISIGAILLAYKWIKR